MFGKVKRWFGIEGVKLEIIAPEEISKKEGKVEGKLKFESMNSQTVTKVKVVMIEKYTRGKGNEKLIDEYEMGSIEKEESFEVPADEPLELDFTLPFAVYRSEVDEFGEKNFVSKGMANLVKFMRGVKSEYRLEAEAKVKGVALNPFDKKAIKLK